MNQFVFDKVRKTLDELRRHMAEETLLDDFYAIECGYKTSDVPPVFDASWKKFEVGKRWGGKADAHYWFYTKVKTDSPNMRFAVRTGSDAEWNSVTNPQFIVYSDGEILQALDIKHTELELKETREYELYLYVYTGLLDNYFEFVPRLRKVNERVEKLYYDIKVPYDICSYLTEDDMDYMKIIGHLENAANLIDFRYTTNTPEFLDSVEKAITYLEKEFYGKNNGKPAATALCVGHSHIDVAWWWTLAQTREKVVRTFSTVVALMEKYPEYRFTASQPQLYQFVKEESPALYEKIKKLVKEGRWEAEGAMWVEADCNLSSGESLVRQILFGKRFFKEEFDVDSHILWLPDVFGYSAALPQILDKSGVDTFITSKISWNEINTMPNDVFMWQGIDGTQMLTYFLTAQAKRKAQKPERYTVYSGEITPMQLQGAWERFQNKELTDEVLVAFGYGDGGGGPNAEMLENARRLEKGISGCTACKIDNVSNFVAKLKKRVKDNKKLPKWVGELYLELHRGTYTSQAKNKKNNRKSEFMYQTAEALSAMDTVLTGSTYPQKRLNDGWELILLNQFHDIIPGSSINEVYQVSSQQYEALQKEGQGVIDEAMKDIRERVNTEGGLLVYNPLSFENSGVVTVDGKTVYAENIPAKGYKVVTPKEGNTIKVSESLLENKFFRIKVKDGNIMGIYDKRNKREVIKRGQMANVLQAFEDIPKDWDAWDITDYYRDKMWEITDAEAVKPFSDGVKAGLEVTRKFMDSTIVQKICLFEDVDRIDFETYIDWKQEHILLKTLFPVDVHADKATYDIQFGTAERPTHQNTSWDAAKFEVCAHKFADISEDDYGVSLLNDCKYGHDILGSDMRLTLLKCATEPDPMADKCEHSFVYSLYPHKGNHKTGGTIQMAYKLNVPMIASPVGKQDGDLADTYSLVSCDAENVFLDTVKKAENSDELIVRMYETYNKRTNVKISFGFDVKEVNLTDLMENKVKKLAAKDNTVSLTVKPFEIVTLSVVR